MSKNYCAQLSNVNCAKAGAPCRIMGQGRLKNRCGPRATALSPLQKQILAGGAPVPPGPGPLEQAGEMAQAAVDAAAGAGQAVLDAVVGLGGPDLAQQRALVRAGVGAPSGAAMATGWSVEEFATPGRRKELSEARKRHLMQMIRKKRSSRRRRKKKVSRRRKRRTSSRRRRRRKSKRRSRRRSRRSH